MHTHLAECIYVKYYDVFCKSLQLIGHCIAGGVWIENDSTFRLVDFIDGRLYTSENGQTTQWHSLRESWQAMDLSTAAYTYHDVTHALYHHHSWNLLSLSATVRRVKVLIFLVCSSFVDVFLSFLWLVIFPFYAINISRSVVNLLFSWIL